MLFEIYLFYAFHLAHQIAKKALRHCIFFLFHLKGNQQGALWIKEKKDCRGGVEIFLGEIFAKSFGDFQFYDFFENWSLFLWVILNFLEIMGPVPLPLEIFFSKLLVNHSHTIRINNENKKLSKILGDICVVFQWTVLYF